jgi:hypothetical protein
VCNAIPENQPLSTGCRAVVPKCRSALKHLKLMLLRDNLDEQQCNNFALKSLRGFFHDFMTSDIEGSILWELDKEFNKGCTPCARLHAHARRTLPSPRAARAAVRSDDACGGRPRFRVDWLCRLMMAAWVGARREQLVQVGAVHQRAFGRDGLRPGLGHRDGRPTWLQGLRHRHVGRGTRL